MFGPGASVGDSGSKHRETDPQAAPPAATSYSWVNVNADVELPAPAEFSVAESCEVDDASRLSICVIARRRDHCCADTEGERRCGLHKH